MKPVIFGDDLGQILAGKPRPNYIILLHHPKLSKLFQRPLMDVFTHIGAAYCTELQMKAKKPPATSTKT